MLRKVRFVGSPSCTYITAHKEYTVLENSDWGDFERCVSIVDDDDTIIFECFDQALHAGKEGYWEFV